jgi:cephalosporin hydroxylase
LLLLEIGIQRGASLRMWEEFLPNATIFAIDINPACTQFATDRTKVSIGDQSSPAFLKTVVDEARQPFDMIIDDGSHRMDHHQASLTYLWPHLREGGWYAIEDLHTCFSEEYEGGYNKPGTTIERIFKPLLDSMNYGAAPAPFVPGIESMHVYRGIVVLFKA